MHHLIMFHVCRIRYNHGFFDSIENQESIPESNHIHSIIFFIHISNPHPPYVLNILKPAPFTRCPTRLLLLSHEDA